MLKSDREDIWINLRCFFCYCIFHFVTYYQIIRLSLLSVCYLSAMFNSFHLLDCLLYCHSSLWSSTDSFNPWPHFAGSSEGDNVLCHA